MKVDLYNYIVAAQKMNRRQMLKSSAALGAVAMMPKTALAAAHSNVRAEILKIPGVGAGSPTDSDWQKVGELCLGATKDNVAEGEFEGVELTFMGLNNQNLHNFLFRGFLKSWEAYTGAKINWVDLAQADYNARLQQSIATGTVDFDIIEMGAPFEGDVLGKGLASEMPDWVKEQIDMDDYVDYLKEPVGTWDGKTYRVSIDGDCHTFCLPHRLLSALKVQSAAPRCRPPGKRSTPVSKALIGQGRPADRLASARLPRPAQGLGRLRHVLPCQPRVRPMPNTPTAPPGCSSPTP